MVISYVIQYFYRVTKLILQRIGSTCLSLIGASNAPRGRVTCLALIPFFLSITSSCCLVQSLTLNLANNCSLPRTVQNFPFLPVPFSRQMERHA